MKYRIRKKRSGTWVVEVKKLLRWKMVAWCANFEEAQKIKDEIEYENF